MKLAWQVADALMQGGLRRIERDAERGDAPAIWMQQLHQQADGGGLTGAVGAEEAEALALFDRKASPLKVATRY